MKNEEIYEKLDEELSSAEDLKKVRIREYNREYKRRNKEKVAKWAKEYRQRLKEKDPEKLRTQYREAMRRQRKNNGEKLRAYQCEYMRKYRKDVQGMIPNGEPRHTKEYMLEQVSQYEQLMEEHLPNVPWKGKAKDERWQHLSSRLWYWKNQLKRFYAT